MNILINKETSANCADVRLSAYGILKHHFLNRVAHILSNHKLIFSIVKDLLDMRAKYYMMINMLNELQVSELKRIFSAAVMKNTSRKDCKTSVENLWATIVRMHEGRAYHNLDLMYSDLFSRMPITSTPLVKTNELLMAFFFKYSCYDPKVQDSLNNSINYMNCMLGNVLQWGSHSVQKVESIIRAMHVPSILEATDLNFDERLAQDIKMARLAKTYIAFQYDRINLVAELAPSFSLREIWETERSLWRALKERKTLFNTSVFKREVDLNRLHNNLGQRIAQIDQLIKTNPNC